MIYEVAPGCLIETDRLLDEEELEDAKQRYAIGDVDLLDIATSLEGVVHTPRPRENRGEFITIHRDEYLRLVKAAGEMPTA